MTVPVERVWTAEAPSNIALIKYMGKIEGAGNRPTNTSISFTLPHLRSIVQLVHAEHFTMDLWEPLISYGDLKFAELKLSAVGAARFTAHLETLKASFGFKGYFKVKSANDFPSDCGLASSASSFAALTKVAMIALSELSGRAKPTPQECAVFSRKGSGSSCRSFFAPWAMWTEDRVSDVQQLSGVTKIIHQVVVVDANIKSIPSSEAHKRVNTSLLFAGRPQRAEVRARDLIDALKADNWDEAYEIAWTEFWDMHALFETSQPAFGYFTPGSIEVLSFIKEMWRKDGQGPIVTMDAGANVHLLFKNHERGQLQAEHIRDHFSGRFQVIGSEPIYSSGAKK
jgi:diphosphomevalonate decarboxylase